MAHYVKDFFPYHTIRITTCAVLIPEFEKRCESCAAYQKTLVVMLHRHSKSTDGTSTASHTNYRLVTIVFSILPLIQHCTT